MMTIVFALLGAKALWLLYAWLVSAIVASYLSGRKGYGERPGLASGLLLNVLGIIIWLFAGAAAVLVLPIAVMVVRRRDRREIEEQRRHRLGNHA